VAAGEKHRRPVIVCGAMASDPLAAVLLLGMGIRELSLEASSLSDVRAAIESVTLVQAGDAARAVMEVNTASEVRVLLEERFPALPGGPESG
jgi:phosphotransferase system enzyme I (PtsI)